MSAAATRLRHPFVWIAIALGLAVLSLCAVTALWSWRYGAVAGGGPHVAAALSLTAAGLALALLKPSDPIIRLVSLAALAVAVNIASLALQPIRDPLPPAGRLLFQWLVALQPLEAAVVLHFLTRFPAGAPPGRFWSRAPAVAYAAAAVLGAPVAPTPLGDRVAGLDPRFVPGFSRVFVIYFLVVNVLSLSAIVLNYRRVPAPDRRRRIRWVACAFALAASWPIASSLLKLITAGFSPTGAYLTPSLGAFSYAMNAVWAVLLVVCSMLLFYAVARHRLFDVSFVIRLGVQYLLARNALRALLFVPVALLAYTVVAHRHLPIGELLANNSLVLGALVATGGALRFRGPLGAWLDRRFFREAYDREQILVGLLDDIKRLDSMPAISRVVGARLEAALHPKALYLWYRGRGEGALDLAYSSAVEAPAIRIALDSPLVRRGEAAAGAWERPPRQSAPATEPDADWLDRLGITLLVPIRGTRERLLGLLMLGERKSEEPYSARDRQLLEAIADQIAIVCEVALLSERVDREQKIKREVLARLEEGLVNLLKECPACGACFDSTAATCPADGAELVLSLPVERIVDGRFRLDRLIGRGGMGAVYEASDLRLGRQVAIKVLLGAAFGDRVALNRFEREARASALLSHPNIIAVHDYGSLGEGAYLVMELVAGVTLRKALVEKGALPFETAADWFAQLLDGIDAAHRGGVIHRDLKPENVLVARQNARDLVKVLDFGLAKFGRIDLAETDSLTMAGAVLGTFGYMSPEQLTGAEVDERTDLFAIGVMAVEAVTGRRPFEGTTYAELLHAVLTDEFHLPGADQPARQLDAVLQRCLAKKPAERFQSAADLRAALVPALERCHRAETRR